MKREGRRVRGRRYCILGSDRDGCTNAGVREPGLHIYHNMVLAVLKGEGSRQKKQVRRG